MQALPRAMKDLRGEGARETPMGGPIGGKTDLLAMLSSGERTLCAESILGVATGGLPFVTVVVHTTDATDWPDGEKSNVL